ncbi:hypothetical protein BP00DRAFT_339058, partial [Aspergillus indologenus CBS 114.80]
AHTTTGCGKQGFPSAQPYLSHTPGANPFCCMFFPTSMLFVSFHHFQCGSWGSIGSQNPQGHRYLKDFRRQDRSGPG